MKLHFHIHYQTRWGESLHAVLYRENAAPNEHKINIPLSTNDGANWQGEGLFLLKQTLRLHYHYEVRAGAKVLRREWQTVPRLLVLQPDTTSYFMTDQWRDLPADAWTYSSGIARVLRRRPRGRNLSFPRFQHTLELRAQTGCPSPEEELCVCGNCPALGNWDPRQALPLQEILTNEWILSLDADRLPPIFEYKFLLRHPRTGKITWEQGPNRQQQNKLLPAHSCWIQSDLRPRFSSQTVFRAAGVVIPVFSLRSKRDWGCGDFGLLEKLVDWAVQTGQKVIQLLPVNDTTLTNTWQDSYPYKAVSIYALHPLYTRMDTLPAASRRVEKRFEKERQKLSALSQVDYEAVLQLKLKRLQVAFEQEGEHVLETEEFRRFFHKNTRWLPAYAMFCILRDKYHTADFTRWPEHTVFSEEDLHRFCAPGSLHQPQLHFWYYVQFILHTQLYRAAAYARAHGVILKGDIPIGVSSHSIETWTQPSLFHLNTQAGAPPDDFSKTGQNWGFPTYNWRAMAQNGYRWWQQRLGYMARYFDAYRIDHILGFFRIWEIPSSSVDGLLGQFCPALPLSKQEIASYGLTFKPSFTLPYITSKEIQKLFGMAAEEVKKGFLQESTDKKWKLSPSVDTQRKIEAALAGRTDSKTERIRYGLYTLAANVLFVKDRQRSDCYHPRIAALTTSAFAALSPTEKQAFTRLYNDYFFHRHNTFWAQEALKKLPALTQSNRMLCCAEDLGMIPACVPPVLKELQILSLEIQRMPKQPGKIFADTRSYPYLSVATPSTHDMSVLRGWWQENKTHTQRFWHDVLGKAGPAPTKADGPTCEAILNLHLKSPSMLALISFQDWTSMDETLRAPDPQAERINVPADPHHYWRYRMHITLEDLLQADVFNKKIRDMIEQAKR